jgi:hypothetical protein
MRKLLPVMFLVLPSPFCRRRTVSERHMKAITWPQKKRMTTAAAPLMTTHACGAWSFARGSTYAHPLAVQVDRSTIALLGRSNLLLLVTRYDSKCPRMTK